MERVIRPYFIIIAAVFLSTLVLWLPYIFTGTFDVVYKHWDGPLYIIPAKSLYDQTLMHYPDGGFVLSLPLSSGYFAAHFPLYPLFIRLSAPILGYLKGMLVWPVVFGAAYSCLVYMVGKRLNITKSPLMLALVSAFFTPRFFVLRSIGAPETLFMFLILLSIYFFCEKKYLYAGVVGAFSALTKPPGILLFIAYGLYFVIERVVKKREFKIIWINIVLIPLALAGLFWFYQYRYGDFFKYFHTGAVVPQGWPFAVFNFQSKWVETAWLEDVYFIFVFYALALISLWQKYHLRPMFYFVAVFFVSIITVEHRDIARYSVPLLPFALFTFEHFFTSKKVVWVLVLLLPALFMYAWNFMNFNVMPIPDWTPFL